MATERGSDAWWRGQLVGRVAPLHGLSEQEIDEVAFYQGVELPGAYRNFLRLAGRQLGEFWVGTDMFYPELLGLRVGCIRLLEKSEADFRLLAVDVVVGLSRASSFLFLSGEGSDPPVFRFEERGDAPTKIFDHFTQLIEEEIR